MEQKNLVRQIRHAKTGEYRLFNVHYFPVEMPEGIMLGGISRDVTDEIMYREQLEEKEQTLSVKKKDLEILSRRQKILIEVLQIIQSAEDLPKALNVSLSKIGEYAGVSRMHIFEKNAEGYTIRCAYEWCAKGIKPVIEKLQKMPINIVQPLFDIFDTNGIVCESDINVFNPRLVKILTDFGVKSTICLPLVNCANYGFVGFDDCRFNREWDQNEVEL
jgi:hypothetical protein